MRLSPFSHIQLNSLHVILQDFKSKSKSLCKVSSLKFSSLIHSKSKPKSILTKLSHRLQKRIFLTGELVQEFLTLVPSLSPICSSTSHAVEFALES